VIGLLFTLHGLSSVFGLFGGNPMTGKAVPLGTWPGWWAALIQLVCGVLHNGGERAALFCWAFLLVAALGPGAWALDTLLARRRTDAPSASASASAAEPDAVSV
jgi:putative oxidoreductase